jgi:hypothetical protein
MALDPFDSIHQDPETQFFPEPRVKGKPKKSFANEPAKVNPFKSIFCRQRSRSQSPDFESIYDSSQSHITQYHKKWFTINGLNSGLSPAGQNRNSEPTHGRLTLRLFELSPEPCEKSTPHKPLSPTIALNPIGV